MNRYVVIPWAVWVLVGIVAVWAVSLHAEPKFQAEHEGIRIVLTDEKCALKEVENLPYRAIWTEKGKVYEGCWAAHSDLGVIAAYFSDRTVALIPAHVFAKVTGV